MKKKPTIMRASTIIMKMAMQGGKNTTWQIYERYIEVVLTTAMAM